MMNNCGGFSPDGRKAIIICALLKLLMMSEYITEDMGKSVLTDCLEFKRILIASINTAKKNT